jgi:hypothetical protein
MISITITIISEISLLFLIQYIEPQEFLFKKLVHPEDLTELENKLLNFI